MSSSFAPPLKLAVLDLYNGEPNQGMRAIRELLTMYSGHFSGQVFEVDYFESRYKNEIPDLSYDLYLSSGGPGSPFDGIGMPWEASYFKWLETLWNHNIRTSYLHERKHVLFICHSFQMMCRYFEVADVIERRSESFGVFPVHKTASGRDDPLFEGLPDPFFAADFRHWQVVQSSQARLDELGATLLAIEKERPYVPLERAVMGLRLSPELVGVQFHPEADPPGMHEHFSLEERRRTILEKHGPEKYDRIMHRLEDPDFLKRTHDVVIPNFIRAALAAMRPEVIT